MANHHQHLLEYVVVQWSVVFIETPSKVVSPPINETGTLDEIDNNVGMLSCHDGQEDDDIP